MTAVIRPEVRAFTALGGLPAPNAVTDQPPAARRFRFCSQDYSTCDVCGHEIFQWPTSGDMRPG